MSDSLIQEGAQHLELRTSELNLATNNKWLCIIPFQTLFPKLDKKAVCFNLASYNLPDMTLGSSDVSFEGATISIPNFVRSGSKQLTLDYLLSSDWHQWKILSAWINLITQEIGAGANYSPSIGRSQMFIPIRVMMISEFKNPVLEIVYHNCWINALGPISLDFTNPTADHIRHNFTITYTNFTVNDTF